MDERVETRRVFRGVKRRWYLVLLMTIVAASLGYVVASRAHPVYQASVSILVGQPFQTPNLTKDNLDVGQQVALTYADVIQREPVLGPVVRHLGLKMTWSQLSQRVKALPAAQDPQLIVVTVNESSSKSAVAIAAEIARQAIALSPSTPRSQTASNTRSFVLSRLAALQASITAQQARLDHLHRALTAITVQNPPGVAKGSTPRQRARAAKRARAAIQRQMNNEQRLLISSQQSYASLGAFLASQQVPNSLEILEPAHASASPVDQRIPFKTALAGLIGFFLALGLVYILEFRTEPLAKGPGHDARNQPFRENGEGAYDRDLNDLTAGGQSPSAAPSTVPRSGSSEGLG
jgi:capsular polysaccharide biosynthesis protein